MATQKSQPASAAKDATPVEASEVPAKKSKKTLVLKVAVGLVLMLSVAGGLAAWLLAKPATKETAAQAEEHANAKPPVYADLEAFTVNLSDGETYLQTTISLKVTDTAVQANIKMRMPEVRDTVLRTLSSKNKSDLVNLAGKDALSKEIEQAVNKALRLGKGEPRVLAVLFNAFIVQ